VALGDTSFGHRKAVRSRHSGGLSGYKSRPTCSLIVVFAPVRGALAEIAR
jgi:hypothetical protein